MVKRGRPASRSTSSKATAKSTADRNVTQYADKVPTNYHKCFARWIVEEVGYKPTNRKDLLMGVSIATAARSTFAQSEYLANWREETGEAKRGPKPKDQAASKAKAAPEPEVDEDVDEELEERQEELEGLTVVKLKKLAKDDCEATDADLKGLNKAALVDFILDYEFPEEGEADEDEDEDDEDEEDEFGERQDELEGMTLTQLRKEARELKIPTKGVTAEDLRELILAEEFPEDEDEEDPDEEDEDEDEDEEDEVEEAPKSRRGSARAIGKTTSQRQGSGKSAGKGKSSDDDYLF